MNALPVADERSDEQARRLVEGYDENGEVNLRGYSGSLVAFATSALAVALATRSASRPTGSITLRDIAIGGIATHKLSRLLAKGAVTSPLRAPFTEFEEAAGASEHSERARGEHGVRHALGELLTCPFCLGQWTAAAYVAGLVLAPPPTRRWAAVFAIAGLSDGLQHLYDRLRAG
jgi:Protein of unknown function (DUF1360)